MQRTYVIESRDGHPCITCLVCGRTSYNYGDIEHMYCAKCGEHHPITGTAKGKKASAWRRLLRLLGGPRE